MPSAQEPEMPQLLLIIPQAAQSLGISRAKLYVLLAQHKGPLVIRFGRSVRISINSLQTWITEQENTSM